MQSHRQLSLATLPPQFRLIALWFVIVLTVGYSTGLLYVANTTSLTPKGVQERYRGNQPDSAAEAVTATSTAVDTAAVAIDTSASVSAPSATAGEAATDELKFEKSYPEMLNITHTHMLAMVSFLVPIACVFALGTRGSRRLRTVLIVEPFVALLVSFASMWLMRYVHPAFSYLLTLSSASFALCLYAMLGMSFIELVKKPRVSEHTPV